LAKLDHYSRATIHSKRGARGENLPGYVRTRVEMSAALEIRGLSYHYTSDRLALNDINLSVRPNECVGLLGPNGAGKSTLLLHLNGLLPDRLDTTPCIWIDGKPLTVDNLNWVRRRVGLLFQDPDDQLISATVFEDIAFGPRQFGIPDSELGKLVHECLEMVGLRGFEEREPHRLSHGEKRRVCLAGVLACKPGLLVLDEPTSDLDPRGRREFKKLLQSLPGAKIIATHDLELVVDLCLRAIILDAGELVAEGPTRALLSDEYLMLKHGLEKPHSLTHRHPHG
jgi:cobalt/nickel transport system ATP-binding protein